MVAVGPEMSAPAVFAVHAPGVLHVSSTERLGHRILPLGNDDQVNVVRHEAICPHGKRLLPGMAVEESQVNIAVLVGEEDGGAAIAAMGDVIRQAGNHDSGDSGHAFLLRWKAYAFNRKATVGFSKKSFDRPKSA